MHCVTFKLYKGRDLQKKKKRLTFKTARTLSKLWPMTTTGIMSPKKNMMVSQTMPRPNGILDTEAVQMIVRSWRKTRLSCLACCHDAVLLVWKTWVYGEFLSVLFNLVLFKIDHKASIWSMNRLMKTLAMGEKERKERDKRFIEIKEPLIKRITMIEITITSRQGRRGSWPQ